MLTKSTSVGGLSNKNIYLPDSSDHIVKYPCHLTCLIHISPITVVFPYLGLFLFHSACVTISISLIQLRRSLIYWSMDISLTNFNGLSIGVTASSSLGSGFCNCALIFHAKNFRSHAAIVCPYLCKPVEVLCEFIPLLSIILYFVNCIFFHSLSYHAFLL